MHPPTIPLGRFALLCALMTATAGLVGADTRLRASTFEQQMSQRVMKLVNQARSRGHRCGSEQFPPAAPLSMALPLQEAAMSHARDMAAHDYFSHSGRDGKAPRDRVRAAGYRAGLTGENIAFGPESAEEVVAGWLASEGHCANLMDGRFRHGGVGVATASRPGHIYWVQTFGAPAR